MQRAEGLRSVTAYLQHLHLPLGDLQPLSFQPGTLYQYRYTLDVQLDHASTPSPPGAWLQAEALVQLHRLWRDQGGEELLQLEVREVAKPLQPGAPPGSSDAAFPSSASPLSSPSPLKNDLSAQEARDA